MKTKDIFDDLSFGDTVVLQCGFEGTFLGRIKRKGLFENMLSPRYAIKVPNVDEILHYNGSGVCQNTELTGFDVVSIKKECHDSYINAISRDIAKFGI